MVWRCVTRVEKGKEACTNSSTFDEEWIREVLREKVCDGGVYDENTVRNTINKIKIFNDHLEIYCREKKELNINLP
ncbi:hypothetical protein CBO05C_2266 [Clostridium botulinum B str. Osaka05]|uniref:Uncharacterized protein n=1 Tax=Clostridium botulinum B str. Osaka05 TaxID=1407017 RepID=A0A0S6U4R3_CLOBO|nr:hypothetical protein [Clostridium botulinum]GAE02576.1 hypothetical protein CBO05C_2266 [Clostridium botulinum B str. Osaka05]